MMQRKCFPTFLEAQPSQNQSGTIIEQSRMLIKFLVDLTDKNRCTKLISKNIMNIHWRKNCRKAQKPTKGISLSELRALCVFRSITLFAVFGLLLQCTRFQISLYNFPLPRFSLLVPFKTANPCYSLRRIRLHYFLSLHSSRPVYLISSHGVFFFSQKRNQTLFIRCSFKLEPSQLQSMMIDLWQNYRIMIRQKSCCVATQVSQLQ